MPSEPLTETAARGKAHQLLDNWLARWPKATINGYGAAAARLGFVDAVAPLLAISSLNLAVADIAEPLLVSPAALLGTGEADTAPAAFAAAWQMSLAYWHLRNRRNSHAVVPPLPRIRHTLLTILAPPGALTMEDLEGITQALQAGIGDQSAVCFAHGAAPDQPVRARVTVLCLFSPTAA